MAVDLRLIKQARDRIADHVVVTPARESVWLSRDFDGQVYLKLENLQLTGSFKVRGALNKILGLSASQRGAGVVAASTGNHGAAVAYASSVAGIRATVFVPEDAAASKVEAIREFGGEVCYHGEDCADTELHARKFARDSGSCFVSPYNDVDVVAGQGTIGAELQVQLGEVDVVVASLGGGGLMAGIGSYLRGVFPSVRLVAASPVNSMIMIESIRAGRIVAKPSLPTLSDGTAGGVEPGAITFAMCRDLIDDYVTVTEEEIVRAIRSTIAEEEMTIEGAAAVAVAATRKIGKELSGKRVAAIICGGNISPETLREILAGD